MVGGRAAVRVVAMVMLAGVVLPGAALAAKARPDLTVRAAAGVPPAFTGGTLKLTDTVQNAGRGAAKASAVTFLLSLDAVRSADDVVLGRHAVKKLARRKSAKGTLTVTPPKLAPDTYVVLACVDDARKVAESSETNNCRAIATRIVINPLAPAPVTVFVPVPGPPVEPAPPGPDTTAPAAPWILSSTPESPGSDATPDVLVFAEPLAKVDLFAGDACQGAAVATGAADGAGGATVAGVPVTANATTVLSAQARDAAGNASACSKPFSYTHDGLAPAAPEILASDPPSGFGANTPRLSGSAPGAATVRLHAGAGCTGAPLASGTAAEFASPGLQITVPDNSTTVVSAAALDALGNLACSAATFSYTEVTPPSESEPNGTNATATPIAPSSPLAGSIDPANEVDLYTFTLAATEDVRVRVTDAAGACAQVSVLLLNAGDSPVGNLPAAVAPECLRVFAGALPAGTYRIRITSNAIRSYRVTLELQTALSFFPTFTPASPALDAAPEIKATISPGALASVYPSSDCTGAPVATGVDAATLAGAGVTLSVPAGTRQFFSIRAAKAGYVDSFCRPSMYTSATVMESEPNGTTGTATAIPLNGLAGGVVANGADVDFFAITLPAARVLGARSRAAAGDACGSGTLQLLAPDGTTQVAASASPVACTTNFNVTAAGTYFLRVSSVNTAAYAIDLTTTPAAAISATLPASPNADLNPEVQGQAPAGDTVEIHLTSRCEAPAAATGTAAQFAGAGITVPLVGWHTYRLHTVTSSNPTACVPGPLYRVPVPSPTAEAEPNGTEADADARAADPAPILVSDRNRRFVANLPAADVDVYKVTLAARRLVRFETMDHLDNGCTTDVRTLLEVATPGGSPYASDATGGMGACSLLVLDLPAGTYYVSVSRSGATPAEDRYVLEVALLEPVGSEGATTFPIASGDVADMYATGRIDPVDDSDVVTLDLSGPSDLRLAARDAQLGEGCAINPLLSTDSGFVVDDNGGPGLCPLLDGRGSDPPDPELRDRSGPFPVTIRHGSGEFPAPYDYRLLMHTR